MSATDARGGQARTRLRLQPLTRIHLHSNLRGDLPTNRDLSHLYIFSAVALLVLLLACINFINLVTARSAVREKEVGLRKVVGANRRQLVLQFLGEALLLSGLAFFLSLPLAQLLLPVFNALSGKHMAFDLLGDLGFVALLAAMMVGVGVLAGAYPAFVVSRFRPVSIFGKGRGEGASVRPSTLRKVLVVAQFVVSTIFLSSTLVMRLQMDYVRDKNLGYDKEHLVVLPIYPQDVRPKAALLKSEIVRSPLVLGATATAYLPSKSGYRQNVWWDGLAAGLVDIRRGRSVVPGRGPGRRELPVRQGRPGQPRRHAEVRVGARRLPISGKISFGPYKLFCRN
jgi:putative ABC transport system permease protein